MKERTARNITILILLAMTVAAFAIPAGAALRTAVPNDAPVGSRVCYSAASWGPAADGDRPCVRVARLYEDGSGRIVQENAEGSYRTECVLPNPQEETGAYRVRCYSVETR
jgi:hypothetical protein